jgi:hypothetical protein
VSCGAERSEILSHSLARGCSGLPQTKESEDDDHYDDEANKVDDVVHVASSVLGRMVGGKGQPQITDTN